MSINFIQSRESILSLERRIDLDDEHHRSIVSRNFKNFLDFLQGDILNGEISIEPDRFKVDSDIWKKCQILSSKGFVIGGSVILNLYGFINRPIGDIDVWLSTDELKFKVDDHSRVEDDDEDSYNNEDDNRIKVHVDEVGVMDVFNYRVDYYIYDGVKINSPFHALNAKIGYRRKKDIIDFFYMTRNI